MPANCKRADCRYYPRRGGRSVHNLREQGAKRKTGGRRDESGAAAAGRQRSAQGQSVAENLLTSILTSKASTAPTTKWPLGAENAGESPAKKVIVVGFDASPDALKSIGAPR